MGFEPKSYQSRDHRNHGLSAPRTLSLDIISFGYLVPSILELALLIYDGWRSHGY